MSYALLELGHRVGIAGLRRARAVGSVRADAASTITRRSRAALPSCSRRARASAPSFGVCARHLHGAASVFAISDFLADDEMCRDLERAASALHRVARVAGDRFAPRLNFARRATFDLVDVETGARMQARTGEDANADATGERAAMTGRLRSFCARSGIAFTDWDVAQSWQHTLLRHLIRARSFC